MRFGIQRNSRLEMALIAASILVLGFGHWAVTRPDKEVHNFLFNLDFIPILASAMLFGWAGSVISTLMTIAVEIQLLWTYWPHDPVYRMDQIGESLATGIAGIVVGILATRARRQNASLRRTTKELEAVNRELQQNMERLRKAERMYAVAQLSASLAHEIRNPLESISAAAGILKRGNARPQNVAECYDIINLESQRLNKLLADFLTFARPRAPRFQPTDVAQVLDSVITLVRHATEAAAIEFICTVSAPLPEVQCDSEQLKQVLVNIVRNAVQATGQGRVELECRAENGSVFITVSDEGRGVTDEEREHIFEPFFTTKKEGSGLGLAIASKILDQHGGSLTAQNRPQRGLAVTIQLPVEQRTAA